MASPENRRPGLCKDGSLKKAFKQGIKDILSFFQAMPLSWEHWSVQFSLIENLANLVSGKQPLFSCHGSQLHLVPPFPPLLLPAHSRKVFVKIYIITVLLVTIFLILFEDNYGHLFISGYLS